MSYSSSYIPTRGNDRSLRFGSIIRWAALLTLWLTAVAVLIATITVDPRGWAVAAVLWFALVGALWFGVLTASCLVMIPLAIWRLRKQLVQLHVEKGTFQGGLWDQWMDGPKPV
jgi:hypothetical protein